MKHFIFAMLILFSQSVLAIGEVFKIDSSGVMYCYAEQPKSFNKNTDIDLWLKINSYSVATLYSNPSLTSVVAIFSMDMATYTDNKASFIAFSGDGNDFISVVGMFSLDNNTGAMKSVKATLIRNGVTDSCYSKAKISGKIITS